LFKPFSPEQEHEAAERRTAQRSSGWKRWVPGDLNDGFVTEQEASEAEEHKATNEATEEAEQTKANIEQEALEQLKQEAWDKAYQEGFEKGQTEGFEQGQKQGQQALEEQGEQLLAQILDPVKTLAGEFQTAVKELDKETTSYLVELALAVGKRMAGDAIKDTPEHIAELVRELLHAEPPMSDSPQLFVNPDDYTIVKESLETEIQNAGWQLKIDDRLSRGGCYVSSARGELDARWETRWESVIGQIRQRYDGSSLNEDNK